MTSADSTRDLFISHASVDKPTVRKIACDVCAERSPAGALFTVWLDEAEIRSGQSIPGAVNAGLETSRFFGGTLRGCVNKVKAVCGFRSMVNTQIGPS